MGLFLPNVKATYKILKLNNLVIKYEKLDIS
jgi:hypothetical protein